MPSYPSPIPAPVFDSDESDETSQQSNDSSNFLSTQFNECTRLSFSPQVSFNITSQRLPSSIATIHFDNDEIFNENDTVSVESTPTKISNKRKRQIDNADHVSYQTPHQSPYTRRKNLDFVQQITLQSPKVQRRLRTNTHNSTSSSPNISSTITFSSLVHTNPFQNKHHYHTRLAAKREASLLPSLRNLFIQRYEQEFRYESCLGLGEFSTVNLCRNRLDGLDYAIKISKLSIIGTCYEQQAWREICAYAILPMHDNLIRYYSAWIEPDGKCFIQFEYCNGGSLDELIEKNRLENKYVDEDLLKNILHQLADVLTFMHQRDLAHLDIKPSNIMICDYNEQDTLYKLADLGHVDQISSYTIDNDGDSRYLALELMQKADNLHLDKCDIYSLGLTIYVCATNFSLPKQGNEWQQLRLNISQYLYEIPQCSRKFSEFIFERMCNVDPGRRPSAYELLLDPTVAPLLPTSREYLRHSLKQEREKNLLLNKKLVDQCISMNTADTQASPMCSNNDSQLQHDSSWTHVPQCQQTLTPISSSRVRLNNTPSCTASFNQTISSPLSCSTIAMKQQVKLAGSNMFRYYSSII